MRLLLEALPCPSLQEYYNKGDYVIREGEEGSTFYIIAQGKVRLQGLPLPTSCQHPTTKKAAFHPAGDGDPDHAGSQESSGHQHVTKGRLLWGEGAHQVAIRVHIS